MSNFYEECLDSMVEVLKPLKILLIQKGIIDRLSVHEIISTWKGKDFNYNDYFSDMTNPSLEELTLFELDQGQEEMNKYLEIIKDLYVEF